MAFAFIRLMTHSIMSENPMTADQASMAVTEWISTPICRLLPTTEQTFRHFRKIISETNIGGNLTTDALIASAAIEFNGTIYSNDRDFERFQSVRWINPLN